MTHYHEYDEKFERAILVGCIVGLVVLGAIITGIVYMAQNNIAGFTIPEVVEEVSSVL